MIKALNFTATKLCSEAFVLSSFRSHCLLSPYNPPRVESSYAFYTVVFVALYTFKINPSLNDKKSRLVIFLIAFNFKSDFMLHSLSSAHD